MITRIWIDRDGANVRVMVDTGEGIERPVMPCLWSAGSELAARLIVLKLREDLCNLMHVIREEAYDRGWKDGKGKKRKQTYFCGHLDRRGC